ncbi:rhomboid family intramembrane serine protease [Marinomonas ostreistagni]|uniref:rhomboid family intramembrane serine protease n=1 Tax=Marinomonas ostreistagni TaxID=359209 RepID=UPI0019516773|nr:rhomboid family intramembrane serine protease [Marinomonas ostreistagni]MBM6550245.1 rhomboid family intramembrane serine protease [Marinomonas ostreistagni]
MYLLYEFADHETPAKLSQALWQQDISHRIVTEQGKEQLWLLDPEQAHQALALLEQWQAAPDTLSKVSPKKRVRNHSFASWHRSPMTLATLIISAFVALITGAGEYLDMVSWFTISSFEIAGNQIRFARLTDVLAEGEYWRLLTPTFIHFGIAHLIFNGLWIWEVGRKLEQLMGSLLWLVFALLVSVASNIGQYLLNGYPLFGGLSGLVYGLIAFAWVMPYLVKGWPGIISKPLMVFFVLWLIAGYTDIFAVIGLGSMANEAHLIGLLAGLILAGIYSVGYKLLRKN